MVYEEFDFKERKFYYKNIVRIKKGYIFAPTVSTTLPVRLANQGGTFVLRGFNVPQHEILDSWIAAQAALRNCCAHHARVWNRIYPMKPQLPPTKKMRAAWVDVSAVDPSRLYAMSCCLFYWVNNIQPDNTIKDDILQLMKKHPNVDPSAMGFPTGWEQEPLWR